MLIVRALKNPSIAWLWSGQLLSALGDEIYTVTLIWMATRLMGTNAGYISAIQAASVLAMSLFGGTLTTRLRHKDTLISVDVLRGLTVLMIPILSVFMPVGLPQLIVVAVVVSSLSALFNPALRAFLPQVAIDRSILHATNGLVESTTRLARVAGPGLIAVLSQFVPWVHFFSIDAASFFLSAASLAVLARFLPPELPENHPKLQIANLTKSLSSAFIEVKKSGELSRVMPCVAVVNAAWYLVFPLGIALLTQHQFPSQLSALGWIISAYGGGNIVSNLVVANFPLRNPLWGVFGGWLFAGAGFLALAFAPALPWMMISAGVAAIGGPLTDISYISLVQREIPGGALARVHRLNMTLDYTFYLLAFLASPLLFNKLGIASVIGGCGIFIASVGLFGASRITSKSTDLT